MSGNDTAMKGKASQAWVYRCVVEECREKNVMESTSGTINKRQADRWVREEGWSETKDGWKCAHHASIARVTTSTEVRAPTVPSI